MSIKNLLRQLEKIEKQRLQIIAAFYESSPVIIGSITQTKGRCGKPNCVCAEKPIHQVTLLMYSVEGKRKSQLIRKDDVEEIMQYWQRYKTLKKMIATLRKLNQKEVEILQQLIQLQKTTYV